MPWVPLAQFEGPPEALLQRCRERIDREAGAQRENLLAVTQVLAGLKFPQPELLALFGGGKAMIESPLIREIVDETKQQTRQQTLQAAIEKFLKARFGAVPVEVAAELRQVMKAEQLDRLVDLAGACPSVETFRAGLQGELASLVPPKSTRRPKKR